MHDRKDARFEIEIALDRLCVRKQGHDIGMRMRMLRAGDGVDLASSQKLAEGAPLGVVLDPHRLEEWRCARLAVPAGMIDGAFEPANLRSVDAVLMGEVAANPDRGGHCIEGDADALAFEVLRHTDAGLAVDVDVAVAEHA